MVVVPVAEHSGQFLFGSMATPVSRASTLSILLQIVHSLLCREDHLLFEFYVILQLWVRVLQCFLVGFLQRTCFSRRISTRRCCVESTRCSHSSFPSFVLPFAIEVECCQVQTGAPLGMSPRHRDIAESDRGAFRLTTRLSVNSNCECIRGAS